MCILHLYLQIATFSSSPIIYYQSQTLGRSPLYCQCQTTLDIMGRILSLTEMLQVFTCFPIKTMKFWFWPPWHMSTLPSGPDHSNYHMKSPYGEPDISAESQRSDTTFPTSFILKPSNFCRTSSSQLLEICPLYFQDQNTLNTIGSVPKKNQTFLTSHKGVTQLSLHRLYWNHRTSVELLVLSS